MHKKLAADLTSLAHSILQLKKKEDVFVLKQKAYEVYEKLAVLAYVEEYINTTPNATETKDEIVRKIAHAAENEILENEIESVPEEAVVEHVLEEIEIEEEENESEEGIVVEFIVEETDEHVMITLEEEEEEEEEEEVIDEPTLKVVEEITEQPFDELEKTLFSSDDFVKREEKEVVEKKIVTLEEELEDIISVDVAADLFEKAPEKKSLNDALQKNLQIGLNDRIAFVKNLFDGSQGDFNRVVSQINSFKTEKEAKKFINKMVKPDYDWSSQEEYEERFISLIERKFA